jgi:hypothetical protein
MVVSKCRDYPSPIYIKNVYLYIHSIDTHSIHIHSIHIYFKQANRFTNCSFVLY